MMDETTELAIMTKLAEKGLHPKILASFPGGRIEEFVFGRQLTLDELNDESLSLATICMKKLAHIHSIKDVPMKKETVLSFPLIRSWLEMFENHKNSMTFDDQEDLSFFRDQILTTDFSHELDWLEKVFLSIPTRTVFSHNDLHVGNLLLLNSVSSADANNNDQRLNENGVLIMDYEYSGLNVRWGDIAKFLCEMSCSSFDPELDQVEYKHPEKKRIEQMISVYIEEWKILNLEIFDSNLDSVEYIHNEVSYGSLCVHLLTVIFFLAFVKKNFDKLHNWKYIRMRLNSYFEMKREFLKHTA